MKLSLKLYIFIAITMLGVAIAATVIVFLLLQERFREAPPRPVQEPSSSTSVDHMVPSDSMATASATSFAAPLEPIPLRDLSLTEDQERVAESFGVDVETFVITPDMQVCARTKLGVDRLNEIIAGDTPTFSEGLQLVPCM